MPVDPETGKFTPAPEQRTLPESDDPETLVDPFPDLTVIEAAAPEPERDVLVDGHRIEERR